MKDRTEHTTSGQLRCQIPTTVAGGGVHGRVPARFRPQRQVTRSGARPEHERRREGRWTGAAACLACLKWLRLESGEIGSASSGDASLRGGRRGATDRRDRGYRVPGEQRKKDRVARLRLRLPVRQLSVGPRRCSSRRLAPSDARGRDVIEQRPTRASAVGAAAHGRVGGPFGGRAGDVVLGPLRIRLGGTASGAERVERRVAARRLA